MNTKLKKACDLKEDDIFILDGVEYIVTSIHNGLIFFIETNNQHGRSKFMSEMSFKIIDVYER
jgi:hypothetical protein